MAIYQLQEKGLLNVTDPVRHLTSFSIYSAMPVSGVYIPLPCSCSLVFSAAGMLTPTGEVILALCHQQRSVLQVNLYIDPTDFDGLGTLGWCPVLHGKVSSDICSI